jgi:hypothetical protein
MIYIITIRSTHEHIDLILFFRKGKTSTMIKSFIAGMNPVSSKTCGMPQIHWQSTNPRRWRLPTSAMGWGLAHSRWHRSRLITHLDWFPIFLTQYREWHVWCTFNGVRIFVAPPLQQILSHWPVVHAIAGPGSCIVLTESLAIEQQLGCFA